MNDEEQRETELNAGVVVIYIDRDLIYHLLKMLKFEVVEAVRA